MALKPITLRLDEEEYEQLKAHLEAFGDPDINVAYVVRAYIRDLNRSLPFMLSSGWDLKNYFGMMGSWLKQFSSMSDADLFKSMANPWGMWGMASQPPGGNPQPEAEKAKAKPAAAKKKSKKSDE